MPPFGLKFAFAGPINSWNIIALVINNGLCRSSRHSEVFLHTAAIQRTPLSLDLLMVGQSYLIGIVSVTLHSCGLEANQRMSLQFMDQMRALLSSYQVDKSRQHLAKNSWIIASFFIGRLDEAKQVFWRTSHTDVDQVQIICFWPIGQSGLGQQFEQTVICRAAESLDELYQVTFSHLNNLW